MFKEIKQSLGFAAVFVAAVSFGSIMSASSASATELYDIVVVPAEDDRAPIPGFFIYESDERASTTTVASRRIKPMQSRIRAASTISPEKAEAAAPRMIAWPYTARTVEFK